MYKCFIIACIIFISIPVTIAGAQRSISKIKLIKNYLRNFISGNWFSNTEILNIERERTKIINISQIIDNYGSTKSRETNIIYWNTNI